MLDRRAIWRYVASMQLAIIVVVVGSLLASGAAFFYALRGALEDHKRGKVA